MAGVNMTKIALQAGVSVMTVSLALRNNRRISESTRKRVQAIANNLGYRPDPIASSLMSYVRSHRAKASPPVIAFLNRFQDRTLLSRVSTFRKFFEGAQQQCHRLGYNLEEFWLGELRMTGSRMSQILQARGIEGVIIGPGEFQQRHVYLRWPHFTSVVLGNTRSHPDLHRVSSYQYHAADLLLRNLRRLGYRHIGFVLQLEAERSLDYNFIAAFDIFKRKYGHHFKYCEFLVKEEEWNRKSFEKWFRSHRPEVIVGLDDIIYDWLVATGLSIPREVGYCNLDCHEESHWSGIDQRSQSVGAAAVDLLAIHLKNQDRGIPTSPQILLIEGQWMPGQTVRQIKSVRDTLRAVPPVSRHHAKALKLKR